MNKHGAVQLIERLHQADEFGAPLDPLLRPRVQQADEADAAPAECDAALASRLVLVRLDKTQVPIPSEMLLSGELDRLTDETRIPCS